MAFSTEEIFQAGDFVEKEKLRTIYKLINAALWDLNPEEYGGLKAKLYKDHMKIYIQSDSEGAERSETDAADLH